MTIEFIREASTYAEVLSRASSFLKQNAVDPQIAEWLIKERFDLTLTDLVRLQKHQMNRVDIDQFIEDIKEAGYGKPPQHIVGHEWFYERKFKITEHTLIPRPETEEWFHNYIKQLPDKPLRVIDLGTGSGVLAISHKLERPQDEVTAVDISPDALDVARINAERLNATVTFIESDMMKNVEGTFDLIVSNPPYISHAEHAVMDQSVIQFEPHLALFAEEEGLFFYKQIAKEARDKLTPEGQMILEFGYKQGPQIKALVQKYFPDAVVSLEKDFSMHDRILRLKRHSTRTKEGDRDEDSVS